MTEHAALICDFCKSMRLKANTNTAHYPQTIWSRHFLMPMSHYGIIIAIRIILFSVDAILFLVVIINTYHTINTSVYLESRLAHHLSDWGHPLCTLESDACGNGTQTDQHTRQH